MRIRRLLATTLALTQALGIGTLWANPLDPVVQNGRATFNNNGNTLTIINSPGTVINWGSFNIGANDITRFVQDGPSSAVLNRIVGQDPSLILGALQSNGHVFLVNPNGVVFGAGARVDVNGLIASSLDISNDDFRAGKLSFSATRANPGAVRNDGAITTPSGGRVYLIAPSVENSGLISSPQGDVVLAAGRQVQLVDSRNPDLHVVASAPSDRALNIGQVISQGGSIGIYGALINQRGVVNADSATVGENGRIVFKASDTTLLEAGSVTTARGAGEGGSVHVLGNHVGVVDNASIDASGRTGGGTVLVGGDYRGLNADIANASATYVGANTSIRADATDAGNGGRVIVYSTDATRAYGQISARGGANSGNGGFAEVSGRAYLDFQARADLRAAHGNAGTLLLDPNDITIQAGGAGASTTATQGPTFSGGSGSSIVTTTDLQTQLGLGNVTVSTSAGTGGAQGGHITVADAFGWSNANALTLDADNGISINGAITGNSDGHLFLTSRGGSITQTAPINVSYLGISSAGDVNLNGATNTVSVIAAQVGSGRSLNFLNGGSLMVGSVGGLNGISAGTVSLHATSGQIQQSAGATITANAANFEADTVNLDEANNVGTISGAVTGQLLTYAANADGTMRSYTPGVNAFSFTNQGSLTVGSVAGRSGITAANGDITLNSSAGGLTLGNSATATNGGVFLNAYQGSISGSASGLAVAAYAGGSISLNTQTAEISAGTSGASSPITINNTGALSVNAISNNGSGSISVTASGPLSVDGGISTPSGAVTLSAGPTGASTDDLTINGNITTQVDTGGAIETNGPVLLRAGDTITVNGTIAGNVTRQPYLNNPGQTLPSITDCIANPTLAGCSQVLPSIEQCIAQPATAGCVAVMPSIEQCTLNPRMNGCSAVLPSLDQCIASPATAGCTAVLPPMTACIAQPGTPGCSAVLPSVQQCAANPSLAGCSVVLPTLDQCTANPSLSGCSLVLPSFAQCMSSPSTAGCSTVLAPFNACLANPSGAGCSALLPSLQTCKVTPSVPGCAQVLDLTFQACLARPGDAQCAGILPSIGTCVATPSARGCDVVLPSLAQCIGAPTLQGCSVRLPSLQQCAVNPAMPGCEAVLPRPDFCALHPGDASCAIFNGGPGDVTGQTVNQISQQVITLLNGGTNGTNAATGSVSGPSAKSPGSGQTGSVNNEKPATKLYCN